MRFHNLCVHLDASPELLLRHFRWFVSKKSAIDFLLTCTIRINTLQCLAEILDKQEALATFSQ